MTFGLKFANDRGGYYDMECLPFTCWAYIELKNFSAGTYQFQLARPPYNRKLFFGNVGVPGISIGLESSPIGSGHLVLSKHKYSFTGKFTGIGTIYLEHYEITHSGLLTVRFKYDKQPSFMANAFVLTLSAGDI